MANAPATSISRTWKRDGFCGVSALEIGGTKCYIICMAKDRITLSSSMEDTLKEAEEFGASVDEARKIHELVSANTSPEVVKSFEVKFGPDSANNRAVWVRLIVENDLKPSLKKISELNKQADRVRAVLLRESLDVWPYVEVRGRLESTSRSN